MGRTKRDVQPENELVPGDYVTPPCQGRYRHVQCRWVPTLLYRKIWLCSECAKVYECRLMVKRVKDKLRKQRRRVT